MLKVVAAVDPAVPTGGEDRPADTCSVHPGEGPTETASHPAVVVSYFPCCCVASKPYVHEWAAICSDGQRVRNALSELMQDCCSVSVSEGQEL